MKKTLSFVLVAAMLLCMIPAFGIFADEVIEIDTYEEFLAIEDNLSGSYKLTKDITVTEPLSYKEEDKKFTGTFDGDNHTITFNFTDNDWQRVGVFCTVQGATIKNLNVVGKIASTGNSTAGLIGTAVDDNAVLTLENITVDVDFNAPNAGNGQGGIIGAVEHNGTVNMTNCVNKGDVVGEVVGGLIGAVHNDAKINITGCVNEGDITCTNLYADWRGAGGFIGKVSSKDAVVSIKNSENKGDITADYIAANAFVAHNNSVNGGHYTAEGNKNTGKITSGGLVLPADVAVANDAGIWGGANFDYNFDTKILSGSPNFHVMPTLTGYTAYINGVKATDKVTVTAVEGGDRQVKVEANATGNNKIDGFVAVTIVWSNGTYSTFGENAPTKAQADRLDMTTNVLEKYEEAPVDTGSVSAENPLLQNGWEDNPTPHGSEGNLFDADAGNKYEGWHIAGTGSVVVKFQLTEATKVGYYALGTGNDDSNYLDRQPTEWKLWASVDGNEYVVIDHVKGSELPPMNNRLVAFEAETDVAYKYFKLEIVSFLADESKADGQGSYVQLGQIKIYKACDHTWGEPVVDEGSCTKDATSTATCEKCGKTEVTVTEKAPGHNYVDGVCSACGEKEKPAQTGDIMVVLAVLAVVALAGVAIASKKRNTVC